MPEPVELVDLATVLDLGGHEHVCVVGGGGKTTMLFALGDQLDGTTIVTTTTKMGTDHTHGMTVLYDPSEAALSEHLERHRRCVVWHADGGHKALGVAPGRCDQWFTAVADHVLVEGDGSRRRPFKAPAGYEPVIPATSTTVISCIGASALGQAIDRGCHRPELVAALLDCSVDDELTPQRAAQVLDHPGGGRQNVPESAQHVVAINRVAPGDDRSAELGSLLTDRGFRTIRVSHSDETNRTR